MKECTDIGSEPLTITYSSHLTHITNLTHLTHFTHSTGVLKSHGHAPERFQHGGGGVGGGGVTGFSHHGSLGGNHGSGSSGSGGANLPMNTSTDYMVS